MKNIILIIIMFVLMSNCLISRKSYGNIANYSISDTLSIDDPEISLDTVKFYLFEDVSKLENTIRDTAYINIDGKIYRVPYKISAQTIIDNPKQSQNYKLTGISLYRNPELETYIKELFSNPRTKLKQNISAKDWTNSPVYLKYFEKYDKNSSYLPGNKKTEEYDNDELEDEDLAIEGYENFPLPETIDIFVDLRSNPKVVTILGLEFDYNKLDPRFQKLLLGYGSQSNDKNRKSNLK